MRENPLSWPSLDSSSTRHFSSFSRMAIVSLIDENAASRAGIPQRLERVGSANAGGCLRSSDRLPGRFLSFLSGVDSILWRWNCGPRHLPVSWVRSASTTCESCAVIRSHASNRVGLLGHNAQWHAGIVAARTPKLASRRERPPGKYVQERLSGQINPHERDVGRILTSWIASRHGRRPDRFGDSGARSRSQRLRIDFLMISIGSLMRAILSGLFYVQGRGALKRELSTGTGVPTFPRAQAQASVKNFLTRRS